MLSLSEAIAIAKRNMPSGIIQKYVVYKDMFVFIIYTLDKSEEVYDPFYSVNMKTSKFDGFPMMNPEIFNEVMDLFTMAKSL